MFREYALDPGLLTTWANVRYYTEKFGWPQGRLLSEYPKSWRRMAYDAIRRDTPMNRKRAEERLRRIGDRLVRRRDAPYDPDLAPDASVWLRNAMARHAEIRFQAIIAQDCGVTGDDSIVLEDELVEDHRLMQVADGVVLRDAAEFAKTARLLLQVGNTILLVDPHFQPGEERFRLPFKAMLGMARTSLYRSTATAVKLHTGIGGGLPGDNDPDRDAFIARRAAELRRQCEHFLPQLLAPGQQIEVFIWLAQDGGEQFHNRYIMSESAGIAMGTGMDQEKRSMPGPSQTDDWFRMTPGQHRTRWDQFQLATCPFRPLGSFPLPRDE